MPSANEASSSFVRLGPRACVVVVAHPIHHAHALRQLRRYLPGRELQVIESVEWRVAVDALCPDDISLLVWLADTPRDLPPGLGAVDPLRGQAEDAFLLQTARWQGFPVLLAAGGGRPGLIYAVNELGTRRLVAGDAGLQVSFLNVHQSPALPYRLFWTWDHSTNWYLEQVGLQEIGALNYYSKPAEGFLEDYRRLVDFVSLQRISGVTIYGFLRDSHGGIAAAQELCRYAAERGVRILPGVGINAYGGIYWEGNHPYNLSTWLRQHPELRAQLDKPVAFHLPELPKLWFPETHYSDTACPSRPENAAYHQEAVQWLAETFEIGGINFETGDYGVCACPECAARRRADETWSLRDQAMLYPRLFEAARRARPDLWLVSEAYWDNILDLDALAPLAELPEDAIYQFCINRSYWPKLKQGLTRQHVARLPRPKNVLRTHMGSQWNHERYELVAQRFAELMQLVHATGMQGATIFGEVGAFSTVNEINYLAFARFGYQADLSWQQFVADDLAPLLGGVEPAERYLALLVTPNERPALLRAAGEARSIAASQAGESYRRWVWLQNRLHQKLVMLPD